MIKNFLTIQFLSFLAVGSTAAFLHWLSRIFLSNWFSFSLAVFLAYMIGMIIAFLLNSFFVFPKSSKSKLKQARDFLITNICFLPIVWLSTLLFNQILQLLGLVQHSEAIAHGLAVGLPMFATFLIYKFIAFKDTSYGRK